MPGLLYDVDDAFKRKFQNCIHLLVHTSQCRIGDCHLPACLKMKSIFMHTNTCKKKTKGDCHICKQLISLCCYHTMNCKATTCLVPICSGIKRKVKNPTPQQRKRQMEMLRGHLAALNARDSPPPPPSPIAMATLPSTSDPSQAAPEEQQNAIHNE